MKYYEILCSADFEIVGAIPQVYYVEISGTTQSYDDLINYQRHPNFEPVFRGRKKLDANFTDLMSCTGLSTGKGLLVNKKFYDIAGKFPLPGCADYLFDIKDAEKNSAIAYKYMHIVFCEELKSLIDYSRSAFYGKDNSNEIKQVQIKDWNHWFDSNSNQSDEIRSVIEAKTIYLRGKENRLPGIVRMPFSAAILVSERLRESLEKKKISGTDFAVKDFEMIAEN